MWRLIALFALGSVVGCLQATKYSYANASQTSEFALVSIGDHAGYLITWDARATKQFAASPALIK